MSNVIEFAGVSKRFQIDRDRRASIHERVTSLFRKRLEAEVFWALRDVSFTIGRGETVGLIGHNGSGKSTTLKLVSRILGPTHGAVTVNGRVSALLELGSGFHPDLTGRENIYLNGSLLGYSRAEMDRSADEIIEFSELGDFIDMPVKHYSSGMYMRLGFAIAISVDPDILITDEVLAVGDEAFQRKCLDRIYRIKEQGRTILFVSHALAQVENLCSRVLWFDHGQLIADGATIATVDAYLQVTNEVERQRLIEERRALGLPDHHADEAWRRGTYEAEIVQVESLDREGQPRELFSPGEPLILRLHYDAHERIAAPVFGVGIANRSGVLVDGPNTRFANFPIDAIEGRGYVDYRIPTLPLLEGEYLVSVAITDQSMTHLYDHHDRKYSFRIQATTLRERMGLVAIPAEWSWSQE